MALVARSINVDASYATGDAIWFDVPKTTISMFASNAGGPSSNFKLEGTIDSQKWFTLTEGALTNKPMTSLNVAVIGVRVNMIARGSGNGAVEAWIAAA